MSSRFVLAFLALAACSESTLPADEWVRASAHADGDAMLAIENRGEDAVYVRVLDPDEEWMSLGCSPQSCLRVGAGETVRVPYAEIINYDVGDERAAVNWWLFDEAGARTLATGVVIAEL